MTEDELEFYYFQVHDIDKNSKLDGLEILQAIIHINEHDDESYQEDTDEDKKPPISIMSFDSYVGKVQLFNIKLIIR